MCQLIAIHYTGDEEFSSAFMVDLLSINSSDKINDDGTGLSQDDNLWKSEDRAGDITSLGKEAFLIIKDGGVALGHVRAASPGVPVCYDNSHPFVSERTGVILYHNGTLSMINPSKEHKKRSHAEKRAYSDSRLFLDELEKTLLGMKKRNVSDAIIETMKNFYGKFAFLIHDIETGNSFAARGTTADLHMAFLGTEKNPEGYVINTKIAPLETCIAEYTNRAAATGRTPVAFSSIRPLADNSVFFLGKNSPVPIGEVIENKRPTTYTHTPARSSRYCDNKGNTTVPFVSTMDKEDRKNTARIVKYMTEHFLSPADIDAMCMMVLCKPLCEIDSEALGTFVDNIIPKTSASRTIKLFLKNKKYPFIPDAVYTEIGLLWPWMVNDDNDVRAAIMEYESTYI